MSHLLRSAALGALPGIDHAFETRHAGLSELRPRRVARLRQVHGNQVHVIDAHTDLAPYLHASIQERPAGDALVTDVTEITVAVATADCAPVLLADARRRVVAAIHAGWRGVAAGVVPAALQAMQECFGSAAGDCVAAIGPCVSAARYEVSAEVRDAFLEQQLDAGLFQPTRPGHWTCDLPGAVAEQLRRAGVGVVDDLRRCTVSEAQSFHSWRRDGSAAGRMLAGILLLAEAA